MSRKRKKLSRQALPHFRQGNGVFLGQPPDVLELGVCPEGFPAEAGHLEPDQAPGGLPLHDLMVRLQPVHGVFP